MKIVIAAKMFLAMFLAMIVAHPPFMVDACQRLHPHLLMLFRASAGPAPPESSSARNPRL